MIMMKIFLIMLCFTSLFVACNSSATKREMVSGLTPYETVNYFWTKSKEGHEKAVENIVTVSPSSYTDSCSSLDAQKDLDEGILIPNTNELEKEIFKDKSNPSVKFGRFLNPKEPKYPVYIWANLIYVNKYSVDNILIEEVNIFSNQSRVKVHYTDPSSQNDFVLYFFLIKDDEEWRIFQINTPFLMKNIPNENFGISSSKCEP